MLAQTSVARPVLFLIAHRPGDDADAVGAPPGLPHFSEIGLGELDVEACREIIARQALASWRDRVGDVPDVLFTTVLERAEGNPFFLEELLTFIHSQGVNPTDAAALKALDLPDNLQSLVLSRIDTLTEGPRRAAKVASVIGRMFPTSMLRGVYPDLGTEREVATAPRGAAAGRFDHARAAGGFR